MHALDQGPHRDVTEQRAEHRSHLFVAARAIILGHHCLAVLRIFLHFDHADFRQERPSLRQFCLVKINNLAGLPHATTDRHRATRSDQDANECARTQS